MMPTVKEQQKTKPAVGRRQSLAPGTKPAAGRRQSLAPRGTKPKGIKLANFYRSPEKKPAAKRRSAAKIAAKQPPMETAAHINLTEFVPSPKKAASKHTYLTDSDIMESLDDMFDKTPADGKRPPKTFETEAPEKTKPRRVTVHIKSPIVAVSRTLLQKPGKQSPVKNAKSPAKSTPVKTPGKKSAKTPAKTTTKTPAETQTVTPAKTPAKTPSTSPAKTPSKMASKTPARSTRKSVANKKTPLKRLKTPAKTLKTPAQKTKTPAQKTNTPAKSPATLPKVQASETPSSTPKPNLKRKGGEDEAVAPSKRAKLETPTPASAKQPSASAKQPSAKKPAGRPILVAKKTPALRKLSARTVTPAQVNPAKLLRVNLKRQVETAIVQKIAQKPDSSPYLLAPQVQQTTNQSINQSITFNQSIIQSITFNQSINHSNNAGVHIVSENIKKLSILIFSFFSFFSLFFL